jgi:hypothetical protein
VRLIALVFALVVGTTISAMVWGQVKSGPAANAISVAIRSRQREEVDTQLSLGR